MKNIQESFFESKTLQEVVEGQMVDEGFKEFIKSVKDKFKQAFAPRKDSPDVKNRS